MTALLSLAEIAAEIRAKRARLKMSQTALAHKAGLTQNKISRAEDAQHKDYDLKRSVSDLLDVLLSER